MPKPYFYALLRADTRSKLSFYLISSIAYYKEKNIKLRTTKVKYNIAFSLT